jgi:hypothetical protein
MAGKFGRKASMEMGVRFALRFLFWRRLKDQLGKSPEIHSLNNLKVRAARFAAKRRFLSFFKSDSFFTRSPSSRL